MNTPFAHLNIAAIRAERRARFRRRISETVCLAIVALIAVVLAHSALSTALAIPDLAAQAIALKGM